MSFCWNEMRWGYRQSKSWLVRRSKRLILHCRQVNQNNNHNSYNLTIFTSIAVSSNNLLYKLAGTAADCGLLNDHSTPTSVEHFCTTLFSIAASNWRTVMFFGCYFALKWKFIIRSRKLMSRSRWIAAFHWTSNGFSNLSKILSFICRFPGNNYPVG